MQFQEFFTTSYLFDPVPTQDSRLYLPLFVLFGLLFILAIVLKFVKGEYEKITGRFFYNFLVVGISGLVYLFSRYEGLPYLASRLFLLLTLTTLIIWLMINMIWIFKYIPNYKKIKYQQDKYTRYLPKKKHKR